MSMIKRATFQVLSAQMGQIPAPSSDPMRRTAHRWNPDYSPQPGMLYVRSRAISSRTNDNFDNFPAEEIREGWRTFIGKPVFVNHHNANHHRARGVMIDAVLHEDVTADGKPDTWVEVLMEVDAVRFPKLSQAILKRKITRTSMGTSVGLSVCSYCGNEAEDASQFCRHIPAMKGQRIVRTSPDGTREAVLVYEICRKLSFFENSLLMEDPADPTAVAWIDGGQDEQALATLMSTTSSLSSTPAEPLTLEMLRHARDHFPSRIPGRITGSHTAATERGTMSTQPSGLKFRMKSGSKREITTPSEPRLSKVALDLGRALESNHEKIEAALKRNASSGLKFRMKVGASVTASAPEYLYAEEDWGHLSHAIDFTEFDEAAEVVPLCGTTNRLHPANPNHEEAFVEGPDSVSCPACKAALGSRTGSVKTAGPNHLPTDPVYLRLNSHRARDRFQSQVLQGDVLYPLVSFDGPAVYAVEAEVWERYQSGRAIPGVSKARAPRLDDYMNPIGWSTTASVRPDVCAVHNVTAPADLFKTATSTLDFCDACIEDRYMGKTALGEQRAPRTVDTLRDDACPVCSNTSFSTGACNMCGYIKPPLMFHDPDVETAKEIDLHDTSVKERVDLACDDCGAVFPAEDGQTHTAAAKPWEDEDDAADEADDAGTDPEADDPQDAPSPVGDDDEDGPQAPRTVPHPENLDETDNQELNPADDPAERTPEAGDMCPQCGIGTLTPKEDLDGIEPTEPSEDEFEDDESEDEDDPSTSPEAEAQTPEEDDDEDDSPPFGKPKEASRHMSNRNEAGRTQRPRESLHAKISAMQGEYEKSVKRLSRQNVALRQQVNEQGDRLSQTVQALADVVAGKNTARVASLKRLAAETAHPGNSDAAAAETTEDVESQGSTDGANDSVTPEATTTVTEETTALEDNDATPENRVDVTDLSNSTVPEDGGMVPHDDPTTLPTNSQTADGDVQWSTSTARLMAGIRLARLRMQTKVASAGNDLVMGQQIAESDASTDSIREEISTLERVVASHKDEAPARTASRRSVPRSASGATTPSLGGAQTREASAGSDSIPADVAASMDDSLT